MIKNDLSDNSYSILVGLDWLLKFAGLVCFEEEKKASYIHVHSQKVKEQMPPFSHWPVIAPPAAQFEQNTSLEQNASNHDRPPMTWHPFHICLSHWRPVLGRALLLFIYLCIVIIIYNKCTVTTL